jgi:hypothetical protein
MHSKVTSISSSIIAELTRYHLIKEADGTTFFTRTKPRKRLGTMCCTSIGTSRAIALDGIRAIRLPPPLSGRIKIAT